MAVAVVDEAMLREPRLLVPGMQPVLPVAIDNRQIAELSTRQIKRCEVWSRGPIRGGQMTHVGNKTLVGAANGLALVGSSSTPSYAYAAISETSHTGLFVLAQFRHKTASSTIVYVGGTSATYGCFLELAVDGSNVLIANYRRQSPSEPVSTKTGPTLVIGKTYCAAAFVRTASAVDGKAGLVVDGIDYGISADSATGSPSEIGWYAVSGQKRTSSAAGKDAEVLLSMCGLVDGSEMISRAFLALLTASPYQIFIPA